ncbi:MAG TPA: crossover junction endodeoxyribonuclease RuvC [Candidatus Paceibacterota bacterium]|jgi:crossover junction endodeoxyribonuclease RuvC
MKVLGIDPGYDRLGLAVLEGDPSRPSLVWSTCALPPKGLPELRLARVYEEVASALSAHAPDVLAIETLFFSTNKKSALQVAEARGAILAAAGKAGVTVCEFSPAQVKLSVTGHGAADKSAIARMVPRLVSLPEKKRLDDELDAIAVAIAGLSARLHLK